MRLPLGAPYASQGLKRCQRSAVVACCHRRVCNALPGAGGLRIEIDGIVEVLPGGGCILELAHLHLAQLNVRCDPRLRVHHLREPVASGFKGAAAVASAAAQGKQWAVAKAQRRCEGHSTA